MADAATQPDESGIAQARTATKQAQAQAASPEGSAWVSANAGTGKTHVLVRRVLRLLLAGACPETIICLTFTKAAASEMANRLTGALGSWATAPEQTLSKELHELLGRAPLAGEMVLARRLFAQVLDTPGGLKIQTIHSFCERILRLFPLEARVAPGFSVLTEEDARTRLRQASAEVLDQAAAAPETPLGRALQTVVIHAGETRFDEILLDMLAKRDVIAAMVRRAEEAGTEIRSLIAAALGVNAEAGPDELAAAQAEVLDQEALSRALNALESSDKEADTRLADRLRAAQCAVDVPGKIAAFAEAFLTREGKARSDARFPTKAVVETFPDVAATLRRARDHFAKLEDDRAALTVAEASAALVTLAEAVIARYEQGKAVDDVLDYDDLIHKALGLLSHSTDWVLYRLDGGIDHILIDEAQDNSPKQWAVVELLTQEFFAGQGAREKLRTVFAVGDEKQSIYGFQGASPAHFARFGADFRFRSRAIGQAWHDVPLTLSFRTVEPILRAVDLVFGGNMLPGGPSEFACIRHHAHRQGHAGLIEVWPVEQWGKRGGVSPWKPLADLPSGTDPVHSVAARIADQIKVWLDSGEHLPSCGRPIQPGDILILVRKRKPFAEPMIRALKARGIPVAGADRMRLTEQIAVMDLMALGDALLLPQDDLTLATVLKSPVFGFTDEDLFAFAHGRTGSLWEALKASASSDERCRTAVAELRRWRGFAGNCGPFEFFAGLLEAEGLRSRLVRRLGPEAADAIDEFLNLALNYEQIAPVSLQGFLHWVRQSGIEVRRDMEQQGNQVRVMTVHGAKGLQANIVFLPDTCSMRSGRWPALVTVPDENMPPQWRDHLVWRIPGIRPIPAIEKALDIAKAAERAEYYRLLYVAMTRARDRLYVAGFANRTKAGRDEGCWYDVIWRALEKIASRSKDSEGRSILRLEAPQSVPPETDGANFRPPLGTGECPPWMQTRARFEASALRVVPSAMESAEEDAPQTPAGERAPEAAETTRIRGLLVHKLLELLPEVDPEERRSVAKRLARVHGGGLEEMEVNTLINRVLAILDAPEFAHLFGPRSCAEVPFAALRAAESAERGAEMFGQIDRLAVTEDEVLIVDYKTSRDVPVSPREVPPAYIAQMAAYRDALTAVFPGRRVRTFLLWTEALKMMELAPP